MNQKKFDVRNIALIVLVLVIIAAVALAAPLLKNQLNPTAGVLEADPTAVPTAEATAAPDQPREPAKAYLVVTVAGAMYEPIPLYEEGRYTVKRGDMVNTIQVTADSVWMAESTCDNQDCVEQGVVSLENREDRVLQNMILCLPNEVVLSLYTPEEITELLLNMIQTDTEAAVHE